MNITGPRTIAEISMANSVSRFVHLSHINANANSPSKFYATKAAGEEAVKSAFPNATIVRPSPLFGHEDKLLNSMAGRSPTLFGCLTSANSIHYENSLPRFVDVE